MPGMKGMPQTTSDAFLGGRLHVFQPERGFRSGQEAVLMAAAVPARANEHVLELGCGAGAAALSLAVRVPGLHVTGMDVDGSILDLARASASANGLAGRATFHEGDIARFPKALRGLFAHVMFNPPFHDAQGTKTSGRATATHGGDDMVAAFVRAALLAGKAKATLTAIVSADRLPGLLACLHGKAGRIIVFPLWPRAGEPAKRVIVQATRDARTPATLLPGLVLHGSGQDYTREAQAILRHGEGLVLAPRKKDLTA